MKKKNLKKMRTLENNCEFLFETNIYLAELNTSFLSLIEELQIPEIKNVVFNAPLTTVYFSNGQKSVAKCNENDVYSKETGLITALAKYAFGKKMYTAINKYCAHTDNLNESEEIQVSDPSNEEEFCSVWGYCQNRHISYKPKYRKEILKKYESNNNNFVRKSDLDAYFKETLNK